MSHAADLREDPLRANRAAGEIMLSVAVRDGATRRVCAGESGSYRVRFPGAAGPCLEAVAINTAGGVAGGDRYAIDVTVGEGAALVMTTASAEKVYRSTGDDATLDVALEVRQRGSLSWLPRETILFDRARLARTIAIDLAADARLLMAEAVVFGRLSMGETLKRGGFRDRWRVRRDGRLVFAETISMEGDLAAAFAQRAVAAGRGAVATLLMAPADPGFVDAVRESMPRLRGEVGASSWNGLTLARFCAPDGESLRHDLIAALGLALGGPLPRLWLS